MENHNSKLARYSVMIYSIDIKSSISLLFQRWQSFVGELMSTAVAAFSIGKDYKCIQVIGCMLFNQIQPIVKSIKVRNELKQLNI